MITEKEFLNALAIVKEYRRQVLIMTEEAALSNYLDYPMRDLDTSMWLHRSLARYPWNCNGDEKIKDLASLRMSEMRKIRGFGKAQEKELLNLCNNIGIKLKP